MSEHTLTVHFHWVVVGHCLCDLSSYVGSTLACIALRSQQLSDGPLVYVACLVGAMEVLSQQLVQCKKDQATQRKRIARDQSRHHKLLEDALAMYVVTDNDMAAPSEYMDRYGTLQEPSLQKTLELLFLTKPMDQLILIREAEGKLVGNVSVQAQKFFKEWKLATWIRHMNDSAATAPDYTSISTHLGWSTPKTGADPGPVCSQTSGRRKWMQRWRIRWNGKIGRAPTQAGGSAAKLSEKAAPQISKKATKYNRNWPPNPDRFLVHIWVPP